MLAAATRRFRNRQGDSFLTHGGDDHDHKAMNRARRELNKALIAEQLAPDHGWDDLCDELDLAWQDALEAGLPV